MGRAQTTTSHMKNADEDLLTLATDEARANDYQARHLLNVDLSSVVRQCAMSSMAWPLPERGLLNRGDIGQTSTSRQTADCSTAVRTPVVDNATRVRHHTRGLR